MSCLTLQVSKVIRNNTTKFQEYTFHNTWGEYLSRLGTEK